MTTVYRHNFLSCLCWIFFSLMFMFVQQGKSFFHPSFVWLIDFTPFHHSPSLKIFSRASTNTRNRGTECKLHGVKSSNYIFPLDKGGKMWHISGRFQLEARKLTRGMGSLRTFAYSWNERKTAIGMEDKIIASPVKVEWEWKTRSSIKN